MLAVKVGYANHVYLFFFILKVYVFYTLLWENGTSLARTIEKTTNLNIVCNYLNLVKNHRIIL